MHGGVSLESDGNRWVMWGEIDAAIQGKVEEDLVASLPAQGGVTIDLTRVTFLDSGGLRLLYLAAGRTSTPPVLVGTPVNVRDLLDLSGVAPLFTIAD
ncbi:hypothetical protein Slu03_22000 [Sediminihabitans luteus]|nr:hypothetical protein Slu03_22000 [Sediminihabitans luteus]